MRKEAIKKVKKFANSTVANDGKKVLCFIGGVVLGNTAGNILDSTILKVDDTSGVVKKLISPIALMSAGLYGSHFFKDKEALKLVSMGVAGAGAARAVKVFIKKDVLQGLKFGTAAGTSGLGEGDANEPIKLQIREFVPDLPKLLNGGDEDGGDDGNGNDNPPNVAVKMISQKQATKQMMDGYQELGEADIEIL